MRRALSSLSGRRQPRGGASAVAEEGAQANLGSLLPDQRVGALTQIFQEYKPDVTPEIVERVVLEIDAVVMGVRSTGCQASREGDRTVKFEIRKAFRSTAWNRPASSSTARTPTSPSTTDGCRARSRQTDAGPAARFTYVNRAVGSLYDG